MVHRHWGNRGKRHRVMERIHPWVGVYAAHWRWKDRDAGRSYRSLVEAVVPFGAGLNHRPLSRSLTLYPPTSRDGVDVWAYDAMLTLRSDEKSCRMAIACDVRSRR